MSGSAAAVATPAQEQTQAGATEQKTEASKTETTQAAQAVAAPAEGGDKSGTAAPADGGGDKTPPAAPAVPAAAMKEGEPTDAAKADDKGEKKDKPAQAPEKYELKIPEGTLMPAEEVAGIEAFAKGEKLSQSEAQALVNFQHAQHVALEGRRQQWLGELAADPEVGGTEEAYKASSELAFRVLDKYAPPALREVLNKTGLRNHPDTFRFLVRLGKAAGEDVLVLPGSHVGGNQNKTHADVLFGHLNK